MQMTKRQESRFEPAVRLPRRGLGNGCPKVKRESFWLSRQEGSTTEVLIRQLMGRFHTQIQTRLLSHPLPKLVFRFIVVSYCFFLLALVLLNPLIVIFMFLLIIVFCCY